MYTNQFNPSLSIKWMPQYAHFILSEVKELNQSHHLINGEVRTRREASRYLLGTAASCGAWWWSGNPMGGAGRLGPSFPSPFPAWVSSHSKYTGWQPPSRLSARQLRGWGLDQGDYKISGRKVDVFLKRSVNRGVGVGSLGWWRVGRFPSQWVYWTEELEDFGVTSDFPRNLGTLSPRGWE